MVSRYGCGERFIWMAWCFPPVHQGGTLHRALSDDPRPGGVRFETVEDAKILKPTDALIRTAVTCVCGSDLWPYRGAEPTEQAHPMGHEYVGFVEGSNCRNGSSRVA